jgi:hypothetical protein
MKDKREVLLCRFHPGPRMKSAGLICEDPVVSLQNWLPSFIPVVSFNGWEKRVGLKVSTENASIARRIFMLVKDCIPDFT